jgi:hypothetical protein
MGQKDGNAGKNFTEANKANEAEPLGPDHFVFFVSFCSNPLPAQAQIMPLFRPSFATL